MKNFLSFSNPLLALVLTGPVGAETIYSNFQNIAIPSTLGGVHLDVETGAFGATPVSGWDINPFFGGVGVANNSAFQPARVSSTASLSTIQNFAAGSTISGSLIYSTANSTGGSQDHLGLSGTPFIAQQEGYLGFRLNNTGYGWMRVVFDGTGSTAVIKDWAYNSTGSIAVGNVLQSGSTYTLDSSIQSFTLGSSIAGANSVVKTGANTVTLSTANTYSGATTVSNGTLIVNGNISTSVLTTVQTGATLGGSGTVGALTIDSGGFFSPGNSPGIETVNGNYIQNGTLQTEIEGLTAGNGTGFHDQVLVNGTVTLNGALQFLTFSGTYAANDLIFILLNDSDDAISGTFTGLAQGASAGTYAGFTWLISYTGNSGGTPSFTGGNDIVLRAVPEPRAALLGGIGLLLLLRRRRQ